MSGPVFLTGGTGFLGGAVLRRLIADGREVRALARSDEGAETLAALGAGVVRGDLFDNDALLRGMRGCATVFHVAGVNLMCARDPGPMLHVNVDGACAVVRAAAAAKVARVVHTSSAATIGERTGEIGREDTPHRGAFLSNYERSKVLGERNVLALAERLRVSVVSVNPSSVQGPGRVGGSARLLLDIVNGKLPVVVNTWLSVVDVDDCTAAHLLAEREGVPGHRYLVSGASFDVRTAVDLLRSVSGRPGPVWFAPRALATAGGVLLGTMTGASSREWRICAESVRTMLHGHRFDASRAERELGLRYTPVRDTIQRTLEWYAQRGLGPAPLG